MVTVITDLVDIHVAWACPDVDAVVVPSPGGLDHCRRAGIPASRCHDFGLAVDRRFTELPGDPEGIAAIRGRLGLRADAFVVLVCGGADGSGGLVKHARAIAAASLDVDVVVICGRNERARSALAGLHTAERTAGPGARVRGQHGRVDARERRGGLQGRPGNYRGGALLRAAAAARLVSPRAGAR